MNLTTIERQTLELLKEGPRRRSELPSFSAGVLYGLYGRRFVDIYGTSEFRLTDAGRAALAGEAGVSEADTIDPEAWAALLQAARVYDEPPGTFQIRRTSGGWWGVAIQKDGPIVCDPDINEAIRKVVEQAQAEGREPGR